MECPPLLLLTAISTGPYSNVASLDGVLRRGQF